MGLSGLGDLILTCGSLKSRNFAFGHDLGRGVPLAEAGGGKLAEGVFTARVLAEMARPAASTCPSPKPSTPCWPALPIDAAIDALMNRPLKAEA